MDHTSITTAKNQVSTEGASMAQNWRSIAARDRAQRQIEQEDRSPSNAQLRLDEIRESVAQTGWRGAQLSRDELKFESEGGWRAFTLSDANIAERERERREKMEQRSEKRAAKSQAAREAWSRRSHSPLNKGDKEYAHPKRDHMTSTESSIPDSISSESLIKVKDSSQEPQGTDTERGKESKRGKFRRERAPINGEWLKNAGLRYLARFNASEAHFRNVLFNKIKQADSRVSEDRSIHQSWVEEAVCFAKEYGGLDDERLAMGFARSLKRRGLSRGAAQLKMRVKKLEAKHIEQALVASYTVATEDEIDPHLYAAARAAKKKRLGPWGPSDIDYPTLQKQLAKLARRGFSYQIAQQVLKASLEEAEEWIECGDR